jgi:O-antigen ligase
MTEALRLYQDWVTRILVVATCLMIGAGGMGVATTVGLIGLLLLPFLIRPALNSARQSAAPLIFLLAAIAWTGVSLAWSPYDRPDQILKLVLLTPLFGLSVFAMNRLSDAKARSLRPWFMISAGLLAVFFLIEAASGAMIGRAFKMGVEGVESPGDAAILADRNLARGATAFLMLAGPMAIALWIGKRTGPRVLTAVLLVSGAAAALAFSVEANAIALLAGLGVAALAWRFPSATLSYGFMLAGVMIIAAPAVMGALLSILPQGFVDLLPLSWAMRIEIWRFAMEQIALAPITGHGLDASRVISEIATVRGAEFDRLPLHAHNAGLTIWLETGAVGALLFGGALIAVGSQMRHARVASPQAAAIAHACTVFFVTVLVGSGIWQEWLHASLAFALAAAALIRR